MVSGEFLDALCDAISFVRGLYGTEEQVRVGTLPFASLIHAPPPPERSNASKRAPTRHSGASSSCCAGTLRSCPRS